MGSYVLSHLDPGEKVVHEARVHWAVFLTPVAMIGVGLVLAFPGAVAGMNYGGLALIAVGLIGILLSWIRQVSSEFAVTNKRVIVKTGLLSQRTIELNMSKVESLQVDQDILGRVLNYGTITVNGTGGTHEPFSMIDDPISLRHAVQQLQG
jgi:uncharacterized membrane protein YdbT with pleckstrin-like domain